MLRHGDKRISEPLICDALGEENEILGAHAEY
jgi:hypothetical protein